MPCWRAGPSRAEAGSLGTALACGGYALVPAARILLPLALALTLASQADAASLIVEWVPPAAPPWQALPCFTMRPPASTGKVDAGLVTQRVVDGLAEGVTYYLAVQAYGKNGELSDLSEMVRARRRQAVRPRAGQEEPNQAKPSANISDDSYIDIEWVAETSNTVSDAMVAADISDAALLTAGYRVEVGTAPEKRPIAQSPVNIAFGLT